MNTDAANQLATKRESHLATPRVGVMHITFGVRLAEWTRSGGGARLSKVSWAGGRDMFFGTFRA